MLWIDLDLDFAELNKQDYFWDIFFENQSYKVYQYLDRVYKILIKKCWCFMTSYFRKSMMVWLIIMYLTIEYKKYHLKNWMLISKFLFLHFFQ